MSAVTSRVPISVVVLTFNEARNLDACLASVSGWTQEILVVDSGSTDATLAIAQRYGAKVVTHAFESHARQWQWAFATVEIAAPWVLAIDADQRVSDELRTSMTATLGGAAADTQGFYIARRQIFRGRWIRHGGYYPKFLLKVFRRGAAKVDERDLVDHHFLVDGLIGTLSGDLIEDNRNEADIFEWVRKHNGYARLQAREELRQLEGSREGRRGRFFGHHDERVLWLKQVWLRLPLYVRPCLYFFYRYVLRLGVLDGKQGFIFHFMQALWYRLLVDINRDELRAVRPDTAAASAAASREASGK
jgi:glycosyltransferase involved in cell wall biosynthesis